MASANRVHCPRVVEIIITGPDKNLWFVEAAYNQFGVLDPKTDANANLPVDDTFIPADHGTHSFQVTLSTLGLQTDTATDTANPSLTAGATIEVDPPSPSSCRPSAPSPTGPPTAAPTRSSTSARRGPDRTSRSRRSTSPERHTPVGSSIRGRPGPVAW